MKKYLYPLLLGAALIAAASSCKDDDKGSAGDPKLEVATVFTAAYFGDSLSFAAKVSDNGGVPLSTLKAQLYFGEEMVSEKVIRTKEYGDYSGKFFVPFYANIPDGVATLKIVLQNIDFAIATREYDLPLSRPAFPKLLLITSAGDEFDMLPVAGEDFGYAATQNFPFTVSAYVKAPAYGANGNELTFGMEGDQAVEGSTNPFNFSNDTAGEYSITFNTLTYAAGPFIPAPVLDFSGATTLTQTMTQNGLYGITGISDLENWWIDPAFMKDNGDGTFTFLPITGSYRIAAVSTTAPKYFKFDVMSGGALASLNNNDAVGTLYAIGNGLGKPTVAGNEVGWNTGKGLCFAPMGLVGGKQRYVMVLTAGSTIKADEIDFKYFLQADWGDGTTKGEFNNGTYPNGAISAETITAVTIKIGATDGNLAYQTGKSLTAGKSYSFTIDVTPKGSTGTQHVALLTVAQLD